MADNQLLKLTHFSNIEKWHVEQYMNTRVAGKYPMVSLAKILSPKRERLHSNEYSQEIPLVKKIKFSDGSLSYRNGEMPKNDVFIATKGDLLVSNINFEKGAFCIVQEKQIACSTDYQPYKIIYNKVIPEYLNLCLRCDCFLGDVSGEKPKGMKTRAKWEFIRNFSIPVPSSVMRQQELVNNYNMVMQQADELVMRAEEAENGMYDYMTNTLGIIEQKAMNLNGLTTVSFSNIDKWGIDFVTSQKVIYNQKYPTTPIEKICKVGSGGTPSREKQYYYKGDIPWVKTGEVVDDIISDTEEKITQEALDNSSAVLYPKDSLIIAMYGQGKTRGRTAKIAIDAATNQACAVLYEIDIKRVLVDYLWIYLQGEYKRMRSLAYGNNQPNLNAQIIKSYPVVIPPISSKNAAEITQEKIVSHIFEIKSQIRSFCQHAERLRLYAKSEFEKAVFDIN